MKAYWQVSWDTPQAGPSWTEVQARDIRQALAVWKSAHRDVSVRRVRTIHRVNRG